MLLGETLVPDHKSEAHCSFFLRGLHAGVMLGPQELPCGHQEEVRSSSLMEFPLSAYSTVSLVSCTLVMQLTVSLLSTSEFD